MFNFLNSLLIRIFFQSIAFAYGIEYPLKDQTF